MSAATLTVHLARCIVVVAIVAMVSGGTGCSPLIDPNVPERIRLCVEPESQREYQLYRPSSYDRQQRWPLLIVCHGAAPDSPNRQIRNFTELAEEFGLLVVAPRLRAVGGLFARKAERQLALQREDETYLLSTLRHVRAGHNVSEDRIFLYGFADGAYVALPVGLRHPELFRAICLAQPKFNEEYLADVGDVFDHYQPVYVSYSLSDSLLGKHAGRCREWLRSKGTTLREDASRTKSKADHRRTVEALDEIIRKQPWIQIRAFPQGADDPFETRFKVRCSFEPRRYRWHFGDGDESTLAEPIHRYRSTDAYNVVLTVEDPKGRSHRRAITLKVPAGRAQPAPPESALTQETTP